MQEVLHHSNPAAAVQQPPQEAAAPASRQAVAAAELDASPRRALRSPQSFTAPALPMEDTMASAALTGKSSRGCYHRIQLMEVT